MRVLLLGRGCSLQVLALGMWEQQAKPCLLCGFVIEGSHGPFSLDVIVRIIKCSQAGATAFCKLRVGFVLLACWKYLVLGWINLS